MTQIAPLTRKPQFSGHETFALRQLWLKKACDAIQKHELTIAPRNIFSDENSIAKFGVGKNMVSSIRHWALACDCVSEDDNSYKVTDIGDLLFGQNGIDKYLEHPSTAWLIHWKLAGEAYRTTTWYWLFNHVIDPVLDNENLFTQLKNFVKDKEYKVADTTLKRDIDCCLRTYVPRVAGESPEEISDSVLGELSLIRQTGRGKFEFQRGPKPTLTNGIFAYALIKFWGEETTSTQQTLSFESIMHEYGSPGRVFKLDEDSVIERLQSLEDVTKGQLKWSDTAGMRQVIRTPKNINELALIKTAYDR
jgi:hypothetical protein